MLAVMKHAVIGSGPCGSLAALLLLQAGHEVSLYDVNSAASLNPTDLISNLKLMAGSSAPYDLHQILKVVHNEVELDLYRSKLSGGFSNVWGATWGPQPALVTNDWIRHHESVTELLLRESYLGKKSNDSCDCLAFFDERIFQSSLSQGIVIEKSLLALKTTACDCIQKGLTSCIHGGVWNSKSLIRRCESFDNFSFETGKDVVKIEKVATGLKVDGPGFSDEFASVIIAAGSIGTVEILLNSLINISSLTLQDTRMAFLPLFKFRVRTNHEGGFAFSQYGIDTTFGRNRLAIHAQLYADAEIYRERIIGKFPEFLSNLMVPFVDFIMPHLVIAILYVDSEISPQIKFSKSLKNRGLRAEFIKPIISAKGLKPRLWGIFRRIGLVPLLPLLSWSKPGQSYHLGAVENQILDEFGSVKAMSGLHVAGAISLPKVEPGPITHSAMAQTSRLIEHITTKI
jgi:hypothetical protein